MSTFQARKKSDLKKQKEKRQADDGTCNELETPHQALEPPAPRLFLFLPSNLALWDDLDPTTHAFRLYFLCDCQYEATEEECPTYVHVSDHPWYDIDQPLDFIRQFGRLSLIILEAAKAGCNGDRCCIPKLNFFQILRNFEGNAIQHGLTPSTMAQRVDKGIVYIREQIKGPQHAQQGNHYCTSIANVVAPCTQWEQHQKS